MALSSTLNATFLGLRVVKNLYSRLPWSQSLNYYIDVIIYNSIISSKSILVVISLFLSVATRNYHYFYSVPTSAPLNVSGSAINSTSIIVTWELPALSGRNGIITGYSLILRDVTTNTTTLHSQLGIHLELVISSLHPYNEYEYRLAAETAVGRGPFGESITTRTLPDGA